MKVTITNIEESPSDLPPGAYCCQVESATREEVKVRVDPGSHHQPGDCAMSIFLYCRDALPPQTPRALSRNEPEPGCMKQPGAGPG